MQDFAFCTCSIPEMGPFLINLFYLNSETLSALVMFVLDDLLMLLIFQFYCLVVTSFTNAPCDHKSIMMRFILTYNV